MPIGALIGGIGSLIGGAIGSIGASSAGATLGAAGTTASNNIIAAGNTAVGGLAAPTAAAQSGVGAATTAGQAGVGGVMGQINPYQTAGAQGVNSLASALGPNGSLTNAFNNQFSFNPSNLQNTPGYQFQLKQGLQATQNSMTASGLGNSGAAMKGAANYATGLAGTYYQNAYNNALNSYQTNRQNSVLQLGALQNLAGMGQTANSQALQGSEYSAGLGVQGAQYQGNVGIGSATQAGNWTLGAQQAAMGAYMQGQGGVAAGQMGAANAWNNAFAGVGNNAQGAYNMSQYGMGGGMGGGFGGSGGGGSWGDMPPMGGPPGTYAPVGSTGGDSGFA